MKKLAAVLAMGLIAQGAHADDACVNNVYQECAAWYERNHNRGTPRPGFDECLRYFDGFSGGAHKNPLRPMLDACSSAQSAAKAEPESTVKGRMAPGQGATDKRGRAPVDSRADAGEDKTPRRADPPKTPAQYSDQIQRDLAETNKRLQDERREQQRQIEQQEEQQRKQAEQQKRANAVATACLVYRQYKGGTYLFNNCNVAVNAMWDDSDGGGAAKLYPAKWNSAARVRGTRAEAHACEDPYLPKSDDSCW